MKTLKTHGVQFSLDDFGTGYSSLAYLKRLPLDQLKIDRSFVRDILVNATNSSLAQAIISLARALGLLVIAEGVETHEQRDLLCRLGCELLSGLSVQQGGPSSRIRDPPAYLPESRQSLRRRPLIRWRQAGIVEDRVGAPDIADGAEVGQGKAVEILGFVANRSQRKATVAER